MKASRTPLDELLAEVDDIKPAPPPAKSDKSGPSKPEDPLKTILTDGKGNAPKGAPGESLEGKSPVEPRSIKPGEKDGSEEVHDVSCVPDEEPRSIVASPRSELEEELTTVETELGTARGQNVETSRSEDLLFRAKALQRQRPRKALELARRSMDALHEARENRRKVVRRRKVAVAVALLIIIPAVLYFGVVPRTELTLKVRYNEGILNQINIASELRNTGTIDAGSIKLELSVSNRSDTEMGKAEYLISIVAAHAGPYRPDTLTFRGNQLERYTIIVELEFSSGSRTFTRHWSFNTAEPWMNQDFSDTVSAF